MARVGSDLFPCGQEDLEGLAALCGVVDGCVTFRVAAKQNQRNGTHNQASYLAHMQNICSPHQLVGV